MIYNSLTVNYTSSVAFNSPSFLSVAHLFYRTPRFLYLCVFGYYFPLACITFKLKCTSLLEKFWMCLSEDIGGWQIFGEALFIEKYLSVNMKNALWYAKSFSEKCQVQSRISTSVRKKANVRPGAGISTCHMWKTQVQVPPGIWTWAFCIQVGALAMGQG